jgi:hypothetical protein
MSEENSVNYWQIIEPIWYDEELNSDVPQVFLKRFSKLSESQKVLYPVHWLESEVCNGGLHQFFSNTTGILAPEAVLGFQAIGLTDFAELIEKSMSFFGEYYPREREKRQELLDLFDEENKDTWNPFEETDKKFDDLRVIPGVSLMDNDRIAVAINEYAKQFLT